MDDGRWSSDSADIGSRSVQSPSFLADDRSSIQLEIEPTESFIGRFIPADLTRFHCDERGVTGTESIHRAGGLGGGWVVGLVRGAGGFTAARPAELCGG